MRWLQFTELATVSLSTLSLEDGVYLCTGYNSLSVSHCVVIQGLNGDKFIHDEDISAVAIEKSDLNWMYGVSFLRPVEVYTP